MDRQEFWKVVEDARARASGDVDAVAAQAVAILADLPAVRAAATRQEDLECEEILGIVWNAHLKTTGEELPPGAFTIRYPPVDFGWDFDDATQMRSHLPRLAQLYLD